MFYFFQRKVEEVQAQNSSLESENQKLEKNLENFKNASRSVETLEKELYALEPIKDKLDRDNKSLNKQGIYFIIYAFYSIEGKFYKDFFGHQMNQTFELKNEVRC